jgi:hypothetical protein
MLISHLVEVVVATAPELGNEESYPKNIGHILFG